jgi:hypothetical protein
VLNAESCALRIHDEAMARFHERPPLYLLQHSFIHLPPNDQTEPLLWEPVSANPGHS